jgi:hypothetical protein
MLISQGWLAADFRPHCQLPNMARQAQQKIPACDDCSFASRENFIAF